MIFDQSCRHNANKNILLAGVGVTALPSFNVAVADNYAGLHPFLKVAIMPAILLVMFPAIYFAKKRDYREHHAQRVPLDPVAEL